MPFPARATPFQLREPALRRLARTLPYIAVVVLLWLAPGPVQALEKVSLQLKWLHQFQFAGYYVALERGFYRDAGLDVEIRPGGPNIDANGDVGTGKAGFGVGATGVILPHPGQAKSIVLGVIFQHS